MEKPKVMTEQEWKQATAVHYVLGIKRLSRSPLLTEIGLHLRMYHAADGLMVDLQQDAIWKALLAARIWLDKHPNAKRRVAVETLYKQAMWAYIWTSYTVRRDTAKKMPTKALDSNYASEARFRSGQGPQGKALKGKPAIMAEYGGGGAVQTGKGYKLFQKVPGWDDPNVKPEDLQRGIEQQIKNGAAVLQYYRKDDRLRHMLIFIADRGGVRIHQLKGDILEPYDSRFSLQAAAKDPNKLVNQDRVAPYACDEHGNFYATMFGSKRGEIQHSSILHGKPVVCAGMIQVEQGILKYIDNDSGHYKPSPDQLKEALRCLRDEHGVNISGVRYMYRDAGGRAHTGNDAGSWAK